MGRFMNLFRSAALAATLTTAVGCDNNWTKDELRLRKDTWSLYNESFGRTTDFTAGDTSKRHVSKRNFRSNE